eukprot:1150770-Pelagomonas_calceolata.AAC.3
MSFPHRKGELCCCSRQALLEVMLDGCLLPVFVPRMLNSQARACLQLRAAREGSAAHIKQLETMLGQMREELEARRQVFVRASLTCLFGRDWDICPGSGTIDDTEPPRGCNCARIYGQHKGMDPWKLC